MHFHTSQHITLSHFPHRQRDDAIREKNQNDEQTVHHPQTLKKENKNPSLRIREKNLVCSVCSSAFPASMFYVLKINRKPESLRIPHVIPGGTRCSPAASPSTWTLERFGSWLPRIHWELMGVHSGWIGFNCDLIVISLDLRGSTGNVTGSNGGLMEFNIT